MTEIKLEGLLVSWVYLYIYTVDIRSIVSSSVWCTYYLL